MQLVCQHDPHNPDHLVCGAKWSRIDITLLIGALILVLGSIIFFVNKENEAPVRQDFPTESLSGQDESQQYSGQSEIYLESEALYFSKEGEQIGRGPWPLKAGEETKVKVFLRFRGLASGYPEARHPEVVVTGRLGKNVHWTGFVPIGRGMSYEPATRIVRWLIQRGLASDTSEARPPDIAIFEVAITPTVAQLQDEHIVIVDKIRIVTHDASGRVITEVLTPSILLSLQ